jgi:DNA-binding NarL/FixJ family response regulator
LSTLIKILLADDHPVIRQGLRALIQLESDLTVCAEAADGRAAVEMAVEHKPDIAVLDISLPVLNGVEATWRMQRETPQTKVLIYTMHEDDGLIREALHAGARGYLPKSEVEQGIISALRALARNRTFFSGSASEILLSSFQPGFVEEANHLSRREREIVQLIAEGNTHKQVAQSLGIAVKTVQSHRSSAMQKLKIRSAAELVRYAIRKKLIEP